MPQSPALFFLIVIPGLVPGTHDRRRRKPVLSVAAPSGPTTEFMGSRHKAGNDEEKYRNYNEVIRSSA
jgi:hypothetical protein